MTRQEMREHIIDLIQRSKWTPGRTTSRLAREWRIDETDVHEIWREAMRAISVSGGARTEYIAQKLAELDGIIEQAKSLTKTVYAPTGEAMEVPAPDLRTAVMAIKVQLETVGGPEIGKLAAKQAAAVGALGGNEETEYAKLTAGERIDLHQKAIDEERAKLEQKH